MSMKGQTWILLSLLLSLILLSSCQRVNRHKVTCKILTVEKQVETSGNEDGFCSNIYWLAVTDSGTFTIETEGLWACPEAIGKLKKDSIYTLTIDGYIESRFLGIYPNIVKVN